MKCPYSLRKAGGNVYGLGALVPCKTDACSSAVYSGYFYDDARDVMVSDYRLPQYDTTYLYSDNGITYWLRRGGKDTSMCVNLRSPVPTCAPPVVPPVATAPVPVSPLPVTPPVIDSPPAIFPTLQLPAPDGFNLSDIPVWGWAVGAGALLLMFKR